MEETTKINTQKECKNNQYMPQLNDKFNVKKT